MTVTRWPRHGLLLVLLLLGTTAGASAGAGENRASCLAEEERLEVLRQRLAAQEQTRDLLQALRAGEVRPGTTLAQLFVVDLANDEAVRNRQQELATAGGRYAESDAATGCPRLASDFEAVIGALGNVHADVSVMRLAVLRLPTERRILAARVHQLALDVDSLYRRQAEQLTRLTAGIKDSQADPMTPGLASDIDDLATQISGQAHQRVAVLHAQARRLLAAALRAGDGDDAAAQAATLSLWRDIIDTPLRPGAVLAPSLGGTETGDNLPARLLADERTRFLLQVRLRHAASSLRAGLQGERFLPHASGGLVAWTHDLWREAREIPLQLAMPLLASAAQFVTDGRSNWQETLPNLWTIALFAVAAWVALQLGRRSSRLMAQAHDLIIRQVPGRGRLDWLGNLLRILTPFAPWLLAWLVIDGVLLVAGIGTGIVEQWLAPLARLYILFHLLRLVIDSTGHLLASGGNYLHDQGSLASDAQRGAVLLATLLFLQGVAGDLAAAALINSLLVPLFWGSAWLVLGWALRHSSDLAVSTTRQHLDALGFSLPGADMLRRTLTHRHGWLLMPLAALATLATATTHVAHEELLHLDAYRRLVLRSVRLRIDAETTESTAGQHTEIPADYLALFQGRVDGVPGIPVNSRIVEKIQDMLDHWSSDRRDENSVAVIGDPGMGKGFVLDSLQVPQGVRICRLSPEKRLQTREEFISALAEALQEKLPDGLDSLLALDADRTPTLLVIDPAHRLFLTRVGGLDAWRTLLAAINLPLESIFWCVTLDTQPWVYLSDVFGSRYQFREVQYLRRWGMDDIRSLILTRHARSDYALRFEDVLLGTHGMESAANLQSVEQRFFGLLWDSSRGNPGLALALWRKSIALASKNAIVAGTPSSPSFTATPFSDGGLFVLATVTRHGAISALEIIQASDLRPAAVSHTLKIAREDDVLVQHDGLSEVRLESYYPLVSHLTAKNLLHE